MLIPEVSRVSNRRNNLIRFYNIVIVLVVYQYGGISVETETPRLAYIYGITILFFFYF